jgi:hypothetical protein
MEPIELKVRTVQVRPVSAEELRTHSAAVALADGALATLNQWQDQKPTCPQCGGQHVATVECVRGLCEILCVTPDGTAVPNDGTEIDWNSQVVVRNAEGAPLVHCYACDHEWHVAGLRTEG